MEKNFIKITLFVSAITSLSYLIIIFLRNYNSPENIEERCIVKFQNEVKKGVGKSDEKWGLNFDLASGNYFECLKIP